jgi:hypothetical protein
MEIQQIIGMLAKMQERMVDREDLKEMTEKMDANMGSMKAELKSAIENLKTNQEETMACQGNVEACLEKEDKPASVDMTPEVAHEEVPREDAARMPVGEPRKRRRD